MKTAKTLAEWARVQALGTYEDQIKNGELWSFGGDYWYLSHLELDTRTLREVADFYGNGEATWV